MPAIHIALLGFGTVGKGVYSTIKTHQSRLRALLGREVKIAAVLVKNIDKHTLPDSEVLLTSDFEEILRLPQLDVVIEAIVGREPGYTYLKKAIENGCHVITANKEMFAFHGSELLALAKERNVACGFEASVAGGIPAIQTLRKLLAVNKVEKIEGIVNGTSNFILTKMREEGIPFEEGLAIAQEKGYAEADPTNDVEGHDAFYKAMVLSQVVFGEQPEWETVYRAGITGITAGQLELFSEWGLRFKHIVSLEKGLRGISCSVKPVLVSPTHPLFSVEGVQNAVSIQADIVGTISLQGPGAGMFPTASAIVEDLIQLDAGQPVYFQGEDNVKFKKDEVQSWILLYGAEKAVVPEVVEVVERLNSKILFVKAKERDIAKLRQNFVDVTAYQVLGEFDYAGLRTEMRIAASKFIARNGAVAENR